MKNLNIKKKISGSNISHFLSALKYKLIHYNELKEMGCYSFNDVDLNLEIIVQSKKEKLQKELNLDYDEFRYDLDLLESVYKTLNDENYKKDSPLVVVIMNKADDDRAFQQSGLTNFRYGHRILIYEEEDEEEIYKKIAQAYELRGEISYLINAGHGSPYGISFGNYKKHGEKACLDLSDYKELAKLEKYLAKDAIIINESCSTGKGEINFSRIMSIMTNRKVIATKKNARLFEIFYKFENAENSFKFKSIRFTSNFGNDNTVIYDPNKDILKLVKLMGGNCQKYFDNEERLKEFTKKIPQEQLDQILESKISPSQLYKLLIELEEHGIDFHS